MVDRVEFGHLSVEIAKSGDTVTYRFQGDVDENFKHENLPRVAAPEIIFELSGIENFNSIGIREWIYLVRDFSKLGALVFERCSVPMIDQINMVPDSTGSARIRSFFAPYYCQADSCSKEYSRLINVEDHLPTLTAKIAPNFACESCGSPLDFDALEDSYFLFLRGPLELKKSS